ncbi:DNA primase [Nocardia gipuzkoensis]|uniref:DNA primase n=1 Tax=Nocardia gipuzkoensis TaxID=2749991 RepID=UPI00237E59E3|nr:DNA primase [Nocardia gipuzkoensis]MDE1672662.1 DNA primase [Nocardia gipuzkoensis]
MSRVGRIPDRDLAAVRAGSPIDTVVGEYVQLRAVGADSLQGLCPFHEENSPSFHVRPSRGLFHCFGCGEGGDVFSFLQKIEHIGFPEAVELVADRIGYRIRYEGGGTAATVQRNTRARLIAANTAAAEFYTSQLHTDAASTARRFLADRDFDEQIIDTFGCGFAPTSWDALTKTLRQQGFTADELESAGLSRVGRRGPIDRFRGRLVWPIRSPSGEVLGFGARRLFDDDPIDAKYLNTPETVLYRKSHVLFGLDHARRPIAASHQAVIVEGYTDVMAMHAAGITNTVAACGTAFGEHHLSVLRRILLADSSWRGEICYLFDGDAAGMKAAAKAFTHVKTMPGRSSVAIARDKMDPCELRQRDGDSGLHDLLGQRITLVEFVLRAAVAEYDLTDVEGRVAAMHHGTSLLAQLPDPVMRSEYGRQLATWVGVDPDAALALLPQPDPPGDTGPPSAQPPAGRARAPGHDPARWQRIAVQAAMQHPLLAADNGFDQLPGEVFSDPHCARVHQAITDLGGTSAARLDPLRWLHTIEDRIGNDSIAAQLVTPLPIPSPDLTTYLGKVFTLLQDQHLSAQVENLRAQLKPGIALQDSNRVNDLWVAISHLEQRRRNLLAQRRTAPAPSPQAYASADTSKLPTATATAQSRRRRTSSDISARPRRPRL